MALLRRPSYKWICKLVFGKLVSRHKIKVCYRLEEMLFLRLNLGYHWYVISSLENSIIKPEKLMKLLIGSETIPAFHVPTQIEISFNHGCPESCRYFPTVSTCSFSLNDFSVDYNSIDISDTLKLHKYLMTKNKMS